MFCGQCGTQNADGLKFCTACGADLGAQRTPAPEGKPPAPPGTPAPGFSLDGQVTMAPGPAAVEVNAGTLVGGRYEVRSRLGGGGMGAVYLARDNRLPREVALKVLLPQLQADEHVLARFKREAEAVARLNHANIVQVYDADDEPGVGYFIAMELVPGKSLSELIREQGRLNLDRAREIASGILAALSFAHRHGVVHRDLKPANVLMTREGVPKVADFGLAQLRGPSELSMTGYGLGTPYYMAPEQRRDAKSADHRADVYSFGATLYEMVTGEVPSMMRESRIPAELRDVILSCLEERPEDRPFSVDAIATILGGAPAAPGSMPTPTPSAGAAGHTCPQCGKTNAAEARFCKACGAGLVVSCPQCQTEYPPDARFCSGCGANLAEPGGEEEQPEAPGPAAPEEPQPGRVPVARRVDEARPPRTGIEAERLRVIAKLLRSRRKAGVTKTRADTITWNTKHEESEEDFYASVAARTGVDQEEVAVVIREFFPQAFAMAAEAGGMLVVPHFATFKCRPKDNGRVVFQFRPRTPGELITAAAARQEKLAARQPGARGKPPWELEPLGGESYLPVPLTPPPYSTPSAREKKKGGFFSRLFGGGG
jgi:serine/threonine-protein kinase